MFCGAHGGFIISPVLLPFSLRSFGMWCIESVSAPLVQLFSFVDRLRAAQPMDISPAIAARLCVLQGVANWTAAADGLSSTSSSGCRLSPPQHTHTQQQCVVCSSWPAIWLTINLMRHLRLVFATYHNTALGPDSSTGFVDFYFNRIYT